MVACTHHRLALQIGEMKEAHPVPNPVSGADGCEQNRVVGATNGSTVGKELARTCGVYRMAVSELTRRARPTMGGMHTNDVSRWRTAAH